MKKQVILGGLLAGIGDITFALLFAAANGTPPMRLLQVVASGLFGKAAFSGGWPMAAAGLGLHFLMSFAWAAFFIGIAAMSSRLVAHLLAASAAFGAFVFLVMRLVVLPLSAFPFPVTFKPVATVLDLLSHVFLFALPIVWFAQRALASRTLGKA